MGVLFDDPFLLRPPDGVVVLVGDRRAPVLYRAALVGGVCENIRNRLMTPPRGNVPVDLTAVLLCAVPCGVGNALIGQHSCNAVGGETLNAKIVDAPDDLCRLLVYDRRAVLVRARHIAVRIVPRGIFARLLARLQHCADLLGGIRRVPFVKHVHDGHHVHACAVSVGGVHVVVDGDKADAVGGKDVVEVLTHHDVIPAEAGEVLHHNGVDFSRLCIVQQTLDFRSFKVGARVAVVHILVDQVPAALCNVLLQNETLVVDGE